MNWKTIKDFDDYEISDTGLVRKKGKVIQPFDNDGYNRVYLSNKNGGKKFLVHRLVAEYFLEPDSNRPEVNHKDTNKRNNNVSNLEWSTGKENVQHYIDTNHERLDYLKKEMSKIGKKYGLQNAMRSRKPVEQLDLKGNLIKRFESARHAARELGISYKVISKCCNGKSKSYLGFKWQFASKEGQTTIETTSKDGRE